MEKAIVKSKRFTEMTILEKIVFCGKLCLFLLSFGFIYPTLLNV